MSENESNTNENAAVDQELALLKERADLMGITYHPSIGVEKLKAKIDAALAGTPDETETQPSVEAPAAPMTEYERNRAQREDAMRLVRVVVNCMNPAKQAWEGEFITVSNRVIGTVTKYVPFNLDAGYHLPHIILEQLEERKCQTFYTHTDPVTRMKTSRGRMIKEFNVAILPQLTEQELKDLAVQQALNNSID